MDQKVRIKRFLKRCPKTVDQMRRKIGNKPNRVDQGAIPHLGQFDPTNCRIQCRKRHVAGKDICAGHPIEKSGFPSIGIPNERNDGKTGLAASVALQGPGPLHVLQLGF